MFLQRLLLRACRRPRLHLQSQRPRTSKSGERSAHTNRRGRGMDYFSETLLPCRMCGGDIQTCTHSYASRRAYEDIYERMNEFAEEAKDATGSIPPLTEAGN